MTDFNEAADALRTAQIQKLEAELKIARELAEDRGERIIALAKETNSLRDELDRALIKLCDLRKWNARYEWLRKENNEGIVHEESIFWDHVDDAISRESCEPIIIKYDINDGIDHMNDLMIIGSGGRISWMKADLLGIQKTLDSLRETSIGQKIESSGSKGPRGRWGKLGER